MESFTTGRILIKNTTVKNIYMLYKNDILIHVKSVYKCHKEESMQCIHYFNN